MNAPLRVLLNRIGRRLLCGAVLLVAGAAFGQEAPALQKRLARGAHVPEVERFYHQRAFKPAWLTGGRPATQAEALVRALQAATRHGLDPGCYEAEHLAAQVQIELNLERWRWLPETLGPRYLQVNVPDFHLEVVEAGEPMLEMRAIVGTRRMPTPLFRSQVTKVVLAPYWYVPRSIAQEEILPRLERDPGYLARHHMRILPGGTIRQEPGPTNPLGRVKFILPNPFAIRLHDTPERHLFAENVCAFSHGCIRIEKPIELAAYLLRDDPAWTLSRIEATIARWRETPIDVAEPLPAYVLYWTAWAEADGTVQFRDDIYGYDARLETVLRGEGERDEYPTRADR